MKYAGVRSPSEADHPVGEDGDGVRLTEEQRLDWLCLIRSDNVGPRTFRALVNHYGGARAALAALPGLARRGGASRATRVHSRQDGEREFKAAKALGVAFVALGEPEYPRRLQMIDDAASHRASLATGTIAVLAGGHDHIYPREHADLADTILAQGALVSEMPFGHEPRARDFPRRNRLISGLCAGIVVVEAAKRSGSLITARFALEQGREVFAVPGSPLDPRAEGTNDLIKQGATLVTDAADVIAVLGPILGKPVEFRAEEPEAPAPGAEPDAGERARIVELLGPTPVPIDDLVRLSGSSPAIVRVVLLELELAGRLERHGGALVSLL